MRRRSSAHKIPRQLSTALLLPALLGWTVVQAQAPLGGLLDPIVITGSRVAATPIDLPYSVDSMKLEDLGPGEIGADMPGILGRIPGLQINNRLNHAQDLQISIRGFGARAAFGVRGIKLLSDGIPIGNPDGQGQTASLNLDTAERIEVLRGPFSSVYGNHSGGVLQIFSRDGSGAPRAHAGLRLGAWNTLRRRVGAEGEVQGVGFILDQTSFTTNGYRRHSASRRDQQFAKLTVQPDTDSKLSLILSSLRQPHTQDPLGIDWSGLEKDPRSVSAAAIDFDTRKRIDHQQAGIRYEHHLGDHQLTLVAHLGQRKVTQYLAIPVAAQAAPSHAGGVVDFDRSMHGLNLGWTMQRNLADADLTLSGGLEYESAGEDRRGYENFNANRLGVKGRLRRDEETQIMSQALFLQAELEQGSWRLSAGLRHSRLAFDINDDYTAPGNGDDSGEIHYANTTPNLGIAYKLTPNAQLYAGLGAGFEAPTLGELAYTTPSSGFNGELGPSRSRQAELGFKARFATQGRLQFAAFDIRTTDEIVVASSAGGRTSYRNAASTTRRGLEFAIQSPIGQDWEAHAALTWLDAHFGRDSAADITGKRLPGVAQLSAYGELVWRPNEQLRLTTQLIHRGKMEVNDRNDAHPAPAHSLVNMHLSLTQRRGPWQLDTALGVDNLFDRRHVASVIVGAANGRFYEPGAARNAFVALQLSRRF